MLPVQIWAVVVGIALVLFGLLGTVELPNSHEFQHLQQNGYLNFQFRLKNLEAQMQKESDVFRVISIGSSLLASAMDRDSFLNKRFQTAGKPIVVHRIFFQGANYKFLNDPYLIAFLEKAQPDLLCLEDQLFLYQEGTLDMVWPRPFFSDLHYTFVYNLNTLKHLLLPAYFPEPGFNSVTDSSLTFDTDYANLDSIIAHQDSLEFEITGRTVRRKSATRKFNTLVKTLSENGTQIAVINVARPAPIEKHYLSEAWELRREKLIQQYQKVIELEYWSFPRSLTFQYYWDSSHMNGEGRKVFSSWLFERIRRHYDQH